MEELEEGNDNIIGDDCDYLLDDLYDLEEHVGELHSWVLIHCHLCSVYASICSCNLSSVSVVEITNIW